MRVAIALLTTFGCLAVAGASAAAERVTFSGTGVVISVGGMLGPSGIAPVGSPLQFSFGFDPAAASLIESDDGYALYELAVSDFAGTLGAFAFPLSNDPKLIPLVELYRGFSFFGATASEPAIGFTFYLLGEPTADGTPFAGDGGRSQQLALGGVFRADENAPLTVTGLLGLGNAFYQEFQYGTRDAGTRQSGVLNGSYTAHFTASAVPEPATWTLMLVGFGIIGARLRRRPAATFPA